MPAIAVPETQAAATVASRPSFGMSEIPQNALPRTGGGTENTGGNAFIFPPPLALRGFPLRRPLPFRAGDGAGDDADFSEEAIGTGAVGAEWATDAEAEETTGAAADNGGNGVAGGEGGAATTGRGCATGGGWDAATGI
jgi:hypothetical protein